MRQLRKIAFQRLANSGYSVVKQPSSSELEALKEELAPWVAALFEQLQPDQQRFTDPLAYVLPPRLSEEACPVKIVVLV